MQPRFVLLALPFCLLSFSSGEFPCPEADEILPCVCSYEVATNEVLVDCSAANTSAQIFTAFNDGFWPFTKLTEFRLDGFRQATELPEGVFGDISFQRIYVETTDLVSVHPSALLSSEDDLERLRIRYSHLGGFPWETLAELAGLAYLDLVFNDLTAMSSFQGPSLEELHVSNNMIATLTAGSSAPNLINFTMNDNPISVIPYGFFEGMDNLVEFQCRSCNLGPTVSNGSLAFRSRSLESVYLVDNIISTIEPDGISVVSPDTVIDLEGNEITELTEGTFRPVMEVLAQGNGILNVRRNPILCGCSMAWMVVEPGFLERVFGYCPDETPFQELDPHFFQDFCAKMDPPMQGDISTWNTRDLSKNLHV